MVKRFCGIPRNTRSFSKASWKASNNSLTCVMGNRKHKGHHGQKPPNANKKPPLTHFLCFPLVNETSASQLVNSLAEFKSRIPLVASEAVAKAEAAGHNVRVPLVPDDAIRPLGTLHLTLGVMSLTTDERLKEALEFLKSLDLNAMLREVEAQTASTPDEQPGKSPIIGQEEHPQPLTVSLTSLHALPTTRSATMLHAHPFDPTSRLYPFSVNLRNKFIEAGFIQNDMIKDPKMKRKGQQEQNMPQQQTARQRVSHGDSDSDGGVELPVIRNSMATALSQEGLIPRPLLLHATISNTIYAKSRRSFSASGKKRAYKFDATELLSMFGDNASPINQSQGGSPKENGQSLLSKAIPRAMAAEMQEASKKQLEAQALMSKEPFIWAKDIRLDRLCICEMGAKPVQHDESKEGPILVEEYTVVGERRL
ncbi:predicted protein [Uncinocarpus reesii 1704]|uniref:A-kinase anchor protein 7-like phosphoesterase domain-containing protein n=1 Tax=Uncinocarpus reesii (strain UAMH 1704) TaxID=336963 RepID=C4JRQ0_UNCRE|nr:uncharacterized protein UREG_05139 [Uncinocarpus reesii 1704]EEP80297.1 predicted protein [Uncinocarpus reesii 1704]